MTQADPFGDAGLSGPFSTQQIQQGAGKAFQVVEGAIPGADAIQTLYDSAIATRRWISDRHNWVRVAWFMSGVILVIGGLVVMARRPIEAGTAKAAKAAELGAIL